MIEGQPNEDLMQAPQMDVLIYFPPTITEDITQEIEAELSGSGFRIHAVPKRPLLNRVGQRQERLLHVTAGGNFMIEDDYEARAFLDQNTIDVLTEVVSFTGGIAGIIGLGMQITDKLKSSNKKTGEKLRHIHRLNETLLVEYDVTDEEGNINKEGIKAYKDLFEEYYSEKS